LMIAHGGLVLLLGMLCGLPFAFHLLGRIELWPIPWALALPIPGTERGWRAAHVGNILNGTMLLAAAAVFHRLTLAPGLRRALAGCLIVTVWGNAVFYVAAACLTTGRGLTFGANRFGGGDWFNSIGYLTAMGAGVAVIAARALIVRGALAPARQATTEGHTTRVPSLVYGTRAPATAASATLVRSATPSRCSATGGWTSPRCLRARLPGCRQLRARLPPLGRGGPR